MSASTPLQAALTFDHDAVTIGAPRFFQDELSMTLKSLKKKLETDLKITTKILFFKDGADIFQSYRRGFVNIAIWPLDTRLHIQPELQFLISAPNYIDNSAYLSWANQMIHKMHDLGSTQARLLPTGLIPLNVRPYSFVREKGEAKRVQSPQGLHPWHHTDLILSFIDRTHSKSLSHLQDVAVTAPFFKYRIPNTFRNRSDLGRLVEQSWIVDRPSFEVVFSPKLREKHQLSISECQSLIGNKPVSPNLTLDGLSTNSSWRNLGYSFSEDSLKHWVNIQLLEKRKAQASRSDWTRELARNFLDHFGSYS
ncbi:MAG: hypothetical protein CL677_01055 [Bdellovibrionaceae bacterium]|nr:hypothetical protein [Pseudobdellovibrionaceae bacterium]